MPLHEKIGFGLIAATWLTAIVYFFLAKSHAREDISIFSGAGILFKPELFDEKGQKYANRALLFIGLWILSCVLAISMSAYIRDQAKRSSAPAPLVTPAR